jgi:hypothetical protein
MDKRKHFPQGARQALLKHETVDRQGLTAILAMDLAWQAIMLIAFAVSLKPR